MTTLADLLAQVERGQPLPTDPWLSVVPAPAGNPAVLSFPGRIVVAADLDPAWVAAQVPDGDLSAPMNPPFLHACERKLGRRGNSIDVLLLGPPVPRPPEVALREVGDPDHPRVRR
ncbi:MAG: GNAT family N-acetyltransferase, partial [Micromonosporaceae bacterium]